MKPTQQVSTKNRNQLTKQRKNTLPLEETTKLFFPFSDDDLKRFSKILKVSNLSKKTISQLEQCKDYIIMLTKVMDEKQKRSEIKTELKMVLAKAKSYAESLKNLTEIGKYNLEEELYPRVQLDGLKPCPICSEEFENISLLEKHLILYHPDRADTIMKKSMMEDIDLIERSHSDTCRIYLAAVKAIKKQLDILDKGGRPRKTVLKECISKLSVIFLETTGEDPKSCYDYITKKYYGHFLKFIKTFLSIPLQHSTGNSSLGQIIKEVSTIQKSRRK